MRVGTKNRNWLRAVVISTFVASPTLVTAAHPSPLERAGRIAGAFWGDGYHTCADSKFRLGADLPPRSYRSSHAAGNRFGHAGLGHRIGTTFYDRFDAANGRVCDSVGNCDAAQPCDIAPADLYGSPLMLTPQDQSGQQIDVEPHQAPNLPTPAAEVRDAVPDSTSTPLLRGLESTADAKKYPIRPQPPEEKTLRSIRLPVPSTPQAFDFGLADSGLSNPVSSQTPAIILPSPSVVDAYSRPNPLVTSEPLETATPAMVMPPFMSSQQTQPERDGVGLPATAPQYATLPEPPHQNLPKPAYTEMPKAAFIAMPEPTSSMLESTYKPVPVPPYSHVPAYPNVPSGTTELTEPVNELPQTKRPKRLGTQGDQPSEPTGAPWPSSARKGPERLGGASVQVNPFLAKPAIELARRRFDSSEHVIYQPSVGTLK